MNRPLFTARRSIARAQYVRPPFQQPIGRQSRFQHTETKAATTPSAAKPRKQTSRTGTLVFLLVGTAWTGYGVWELWKGGDSSQKSLNNSTFTPFKLVDKERVSSTCSIFTIEQPSLSTDIIQEIWQKGVWSVDIKQPQLQIARSYTPLPPLSPYAPDTQLRLLVRKEGKGEMSNYIHKTAIDGSLELRGPAVEHQLPEKVDQIVFLAGGTGIAPALQLAHSLQDSTDISILWANRLREDCEGGRSDTIKPSGGWLSSLYTGRGLASPQSPPPADGELLPPGSPVVRQLKQMKRSHQASRNVDYFVDEEGTFIQPKDLLETLSRIQDKAAPTSMGEKLIFVSGPEGFLNYWAGPKEWRDGREVQGPLGGALSRMNIEGWKVVKL